jgi:hypothetical protein
MSANYIEFDTSPVYEPCVQIERDKDYMPAMRAEANRYVELLQKKFPNLPGYWKVAQLMHDFGPYLEVRFYCEASLLDAGSVIRFLEANMPKTWDDCEPVEWKSE